MLIFWDCRMVFLATPKAGSTAVEAALEPLAAVAIQRPEVLKHTDLGGYRRHVAPWLKAATGQDFLTVALMREPVDWLRSWYRFRLRDDQDDPGHGMEGISFADFVRDYGCSDGTQRRQIGTQAGFLTDGTGRADRIFRYEEMPRFVEFLEDRLDCAIELPRLNVPPQVDVQLTARDEATLRGSLAPDVALYAAL